MSFFCLFGSRYHSCSSYGVSLSLRCSRLCLCIRLCVMLIVIIIIICWSCFCFWFFAFLWCAFRFVRWSVCVLMFSFWFFVLGLLVDSVSSSFSSFYVPYLFFMSSSIVFVSRVNFVCVSMQVSACLFYCFLYSVYI